MTPEIALLLAQDGISTGAIYVLVALGIVLIFLVTRVIFVPFGDVVGYSALTLAALQLRQMPGTVWLVLTLAALATAMEVYGLARRGQTSRLPKALLLYAVLPAVPALLVWLAAGRDLPMWLGIALTLAIVLPISPLLYRIAFRPLADASVLVLLIVAVAVHFAISGLALVVFRAGGFPHRADDAGVLRPRSDQRFRPEHSDRRQLGDSSASCCSSSSSARSPARRCARPPSIASAPGWSASCRRRTGATAFLLASALAGISGILIGPVTTLYYDSGFLIGLKAFVGAIIGGLVSYPATAVGAIFVGLFESYASFWNSALKEVIVFGALIPILIWQSLVSGSGVEEEIEEEEREGEA